MNSNPMYLPTYAPCLGRAFGRLVMTVAFAAAVLAGQAAQAAPGLRAVYETGGAQVVITRDASGTVQFDGLPYPGLVLYRPATGMVYYQHPAEPLWLTIASDQAPTTKATVQAGPAWQPWQGQPTQRFDVRADGEMCDQWFGSRTAADQLGMTVADFLRIFAALEWLNGGAQGPACNHLTVSPAEAEKIGLPVRWNTPTTPWSLSELARTNVEPIALPETLKPVDDETRLQLLLSQFTAEERAAFLKANGQLPVAQQVLAIEGALGGSVLP